MIRGTRNGTHATTRDRGRWWRIRRASLEGNLQKYIAHIAYVHFADSNRLAPGWGHLPFGAIVAALTAVGYTGWTSVEILPKPDPDPAARQAIQHLRKFIPKEE